MSSPFKRLQPLLSYEKTNAELKASMRLDVEKWMASFKKTPTPKNSTEELEAEGKML
jgi:phage-related protein